MERAEPEDADAIAAIEARPDNRGKIGEWAVEKHLRLMGAPGFAYFVEREDGAVAAFAIVERLNDASGVAYLRRIAAAETGRGHGKRLLISVLDWLFAQPEQRKLELRVREGNEGARRLYLALGFGEEGFLRYREEPGGSHYMTILREEWAAWRAR
jgi:RimJ/RimL family protein N-acetyltransferase